MRGALIVGIDHYDGANLYGCVNDAKRIKELLEKDGFDKINFHPDLVVSDRGGNNITRKLLLDKLNVTFSTKCEIALFYFAGHGTENNLGGYIVTQDDYISVSDILQLANRSPALNKIIILDSCHSGHMGSVPLFDNDFALIREGVSILTATRSNQKALEFAGNGLLTSLIIQALEGGAADILGTVTISGIYGYVEQALGFFKQRPLFKSHVSELVSIRDCKPSIEREILHKITEYFHEANYQFPLNPSFEPTVPDHDPNNAKVFSHLQKFRNARLLIPVGEEHLYYAAMNSKCCCLTPQGKYYWYLVKEGLI